MKIRHILASVLFASFVAVGVGAGLKAQTVKQVRADADTWMINFSLEVGADLLEEMDTNSMYVHTYTDGVGEDKYFQMYQIEENSRCFQVNATFPESYSYNRVQFKYQVSEDTKWATPYNSSGSKASHSQHISCSTTSKGEGWTFSLGASSIYVRYNDVDYDFVEDVANARFVASDVVSDGNSSHYYTLRYRESWNYTYATLTTASKEHTPGSYGDGWTHLNEGVYDIVLKNNNSDNGVIEIKKHVNQGTFIYYVTQSESATNDYIYTFGGEEQFGAFPGTKITEIEGVRSYFADSTDFKYNYLGHASTISRVVYRIPVIAGYPSDTGVAFNVGNNSHQTKDFTLEAENAYIWESDDPAQQWQSLNEGKALHFLIRSEKARMETTAGTYAATSVCELSKETAISLYNEYAGLEEAAKNSINQCQVWTFKSKSTTEYENVDYYYVVEMIRVIAEIPAPQPGVMGYGEFGSNPTMVIIVAIVTVTTIAAGMALILRKKRN